MKYQLGVYEKAMPSALTWVEKLESVKSAGFDFFELSIDETEDKLARLCMSSNELNEIEQAMQKTGIMIRTICLSGHRKYPFGSHDAATRQRSLEIMDKTVQLAWKIGARIIQLAGYDVYYESSDDKTQAWFKENLSKAVGIASKYGVTLGFETMETPFMNTVEKSMAYVRQICSPYLGIYPDIGNLTNASKLYGTNILTDISKGKQHILAAHLKETLPGLYREVPFGLGHTDFTSCVHYLYHIGVRLFIGEFWYSQGQNWLQELEKANIFLRARIEEAIKDTAV